MMLVRIVSIKRPRKCTRNSLLNSPFVSRRAAPLPVEKQSINVKKSQLHRKIISPCCADRDRSRNIQTSHSPVEFEPLEGGGMGGPWCRCSVAFLVVSCVFLLERGGRFLRVRRWSQEGSKANPHAQGLVYFKYTPIFSFQIASTYVGLSQEKKTASSSLFSGSNSIQKEKKVRDFWIFILMWIVFPNTKI